MKRRSFLGALAALIAAPRILARAAPRPEPCVVESPFKVDGYINGMTSPARPWFSLTDRAQVRQGMPPLAWRRLNATREEAARLYTQRNPILDDMVWTETT